MHSENVMKFQDSWISLCRLA